MTVVETPMQMPAADGPGPFAGAVHPLIHDAEQDVGAEQAVATQQLDDGDERGAPAHALMATAVDGELGGVMKLLGQRHRPDLPAQQAGAL